MTTVDVVSPTASWALVELAQSGDTEAFATLYTRYVDTVYRFVYYRVGSNHTKAEDLTAEAFRRALAGIGRLTWQGRDVGAWLVTIARHLIADYYRSAPYQKEVSTGDIYDADQPDVSAGSSPHDEAQRKDIAAVVRRAMAKLPPTQRRIIELRYLHDLSVAEVADVVGSTEGAVKSMQHRAFARLRRQRELEAWR